MVVGSSEAGIDGGGIGIGLLCRVSVAVPVVDIGLSIAVVVVVVDEILPFGFGKTCIWACDCS